MASSEPSDLSVDATFLMSTLDTGHAEEAVEPVVRPERHEPVRLHSASSLQHLCDGGLQVVVTDPARYPFEMLECADVPVQEHFLGLVQIRARVATSAGRQPHDEQVDL